MRTGCQIRRFGVVIASLLLTTAVTYTAAEPRIVAVGDVHGDLPDFVAILQKTGLINEGRQWTGGDAVLVQLGDVVDRGPKSRECLDLLMDLERQSPLQTTNAAAPSPKVSGPDRR